MSDKSEADTWDDWYLEHNLKQAYNGNVEAAQELMREAIRQIEAGNDLPRLLQVFVVYSFNEILNGADPKKALMLARPAGRPPNESVNDTRQRDQRLVIKMLEKMKQGSSKGKAARDAINELRINLDQRRAEQIFDNAKLNK